jgi:hypothetical protein
MSMFKSVFEHIWSDLKHLKFSFCMIVDSMSLGTFARKSVNVSGFFGSSSGDFCSSGGMFRVLF